MKLGERIYRLRTEKNLSQEALAALLDVSRQSVSKWETGAAVPDLDKLVKLCDVFSITLDELVGRETNREERKAELVRKSPVVGQKVVGYILLAFSLLVFLLLLLRGVNPGDFLILIPIGLSLFVASVFCLTLRRGALYWCVWVLFAPLTVLTPHVVGFSVLHAFSAVQLVLMAAMAGAACAVFRGERVAHRKGKSVLLTAAWIALAAAHWLKIGFVPAKLVVSVALNFVLYAVGALLVTYTVIYLKNAKAK